MRSLVGDHAGDSVEQCNVRARSRAQPEIGDVAHLYAARIDDDRLGATLHDRAPHSSRGHGMVRVGV
jgi:hypothetical protein